MQSEQQRRPFRHLGVAAFVLGAAMLANVAPLRGEQAQLDELSPDFVIYEWIDESGRVDFVANPSGVAFDDSGNIYVLDAGNHRVAVFSEHGEFIRSFGRAGDGPGELALGRSYYAADVAVDGDVVFVSDPVLRRLHAFSRGGDLIHTSAITQAINSLAARDESVYLTIQGFSADLPADIVRFDASAVMNGEPLTPAALSEPLIPFSDSPTSRYNQSQIAVGNGAKLMQVYWWWPVVRFHLPGISSETFHDKEWWPDSRHEPELIQSLEGALTVAKRGGMPAAQTRFPFFRDVEYVPDTNQWATLVNGNTVHVFDDSRKLIRHIRLLSDDGEDAPTFGDIGVDRGGTLLCAADATVRSFVACYFLTENP